MRKLLLILVAVFIVGCSSVPTRNASTIIVTGTGPTEEIAKQNGFKQAIQIVVGSVVVSEKESQSYKLIKDDILDYSAGYIDYHKVLNSTKLGNLYRVEMEVTVAQSRIAERILKININPNNIKGEQMATTYSTYLKHTDDSNRLLRQVLDSYPKYAYFIKLGDMELKLNGDRKAVIVIPYQVEWNYRFLDALYEVLNYSKEGSVLGWTDRAPSTISMYMYTGSHTFKFLDPYKAQMLNQTLGNYPVLKFSFFDKNHKKVLSVCDDTSGMNKFFRNYGAYDKNPVIFSPKLKWKFEQVIERNEIQSLNDFASVIPEMMMYDDCIKSLHADNR